MAVPPLLIACCLDGGTSTPRVRHGVLDLYLEINSINLLPICAIFYELVHRRVSSALNGTRFWLTSSSVAPDCSSWVFSRCLLRFRAYNLTPGQSSLLSDIVWVEICSYSALNWQVHFLKLFDFCVLSCNSLLTFFPAMTSAFPH